ncbi:MAG: hypothetical protein U0105_09810 [Candidatus Obscuribacterales bacterium]
MLKSIWHAMLNRFQEANKSALIQQVTSSYSELGNKPDGILKFITEDRVRVRIDHPRTLAETGSELGCLDDTQQKQLSSLENILKKQDDDAERRVEKSWYYGDAGKWVRYAALDARQAVSNNLEAMTKQASLEPILLGVARAHAPFREYYDCDDEDGYGSATFGEILRDLLALQKEIEGKQSFDLDFLYEMQAE